VLHTIIYIVAYVDPFLCGFHMARCWTTLF